MKKYQYKCTLLSDVVITSMAATEGYKESLDYIPGSKFLGIVAKELYDERNSEKTLDLFHNGKVKYSDAILLYGNSALLKVPFSWYHEKGKAISDDIYLYHNLSKNNNSQLKQARAGYFSPESNVFIALNQEFSLKSAQDAAKRRSKDGQMFGYYSLKAGTEWTFIIEDEKGIYADEIKNIITGKQCIGRSRSAEYGLVNIAFLNEVKNEDEKQLNSKIILYAKSNLCFLDDDTGRFTARPTAKQLTGIENAEILWEKCQVRTRNYKTWNRYRNNKDAERLIIERGSVFVIKLNNPASSNYFARGIGSFKNEGFGEVLVNPGFLISDNENLSINLVKKEIKSASINAVEKGVNDKEVLNCLKKIRLRNRFDYSIDKMVNDFIQTNKKSFGKGISKSQWGTLRNYGKHLNTKKQFETMVFDKSVGFLYRGQSENEWRQKNRRVILENFLKNLKEEEYLPFIIKLSNQMAKSPKE